MSIFLHVIKMYHKCLAAFTSNVQNLMCIYASPLHLLTHSVCLFSQMLRAERL